jgi:hypothetical protein
VFFGILLVLVVRVRELRRVMLGPRVSTPVRIQSFIIDLVHTSAQNHKQIKINPRSRMVE